MSWKNKKKLKIVSFFGKYFSCQTLHIILILNIGSLSALRSKTILSKQSRSGDHTITSERNLTTILYGSTYKNMSCGCGCGIINGKQCSHTYYNRAENGLYGNGRCRSMHCMATHLKWNNFLIGFRGTFMWLFSPKFNSNLNGCSIWPYLLIAKWNLIR